MEILQAILFILILSALGFGLRRYQKYRRREPFICEYKFPEGLTSRLQILQPKLSQEQLSRIVDGLREYFQICRLANRMPVAMPSKVIDQAWHEFILHTKEYKNFCDQAFGHFLHHTPARAMDESDRQVHKLRRTWKISSQRANSDPLKPSVIPLIFSLDMELDILDGFFYTLDEQHLSTPDENPSGQSYFAGNIGCSSDTHSSGSSFDSSGDSGCSGDCSS